MSCNRSRRAFASSASSACYGSDAAANPLAYPQAGWEAFQRLPLTEAEFRLIANNVAPYMQDFPAR
jgi:hypothetical protein